MNENISAEKPVIIERVSEMYLPELMDLRPPEVPPIMGEEYLNALKECKSNVQNMIADSNRAFSTFEIEDLSHILENGRRAGNEKIDKCIGQFQEKARQFIRSKSAYMKAGLGVEGYFADYDYWAMHERIQMLESLWLSVGLEPREDLINRAKNSLDRPLETIPNTWDREMGRRRELFLRKFSSYAVRELPIEKFTTWIYSIKLELHPDYKNMLDTIVERKRQNAEVDTTSPVADRPLEGREFASASTLIAAMAIDAYGYDPTQKRSPVPNEMQGIIDRLGLSISADTIRKYLKTGSRNLPPNWKPEK